MVSAKKKKITQKKTNEKTSMADLCTLYLGQWISKCGPQTSRALLEMEILRPYPRLLTQKGWELSPAPCALTSSPRASAVS